MRGFSQMGVGSTAPGARLQLEDMRLTGNGDGVYAGRLAALRVQADGNARYGIAGLEGDVAQSTATNNGDAGIYVLAGTAVGNQAYLNAHAGMHFGSAVAYSGNSSMANAPNYRAGGAGSANASF